MAVSLDKKVIMIQEHEPLDGVNSVACLVFDIDSFRKISELDVEIIDDSIYDDPNIETPEDVYYEEDYNYPWSTKYSTKEELPLI